MAYTQTNFKTKKALSEALQNGPQDGYENTPWGTQPLKDGTAYIEGPHGVHRWYAKVKVENGKIVKLLG